MGLNFFVEQEILQAPLGNYKPLLENFKTAGNFRLMLLTTSNKFQATM